MIPRASPLFRSVAPRHERWARLSMLGALVLGTAAGCGGESSSRSSSSTHWLACDVDADCENLGIGAHCGEGGYCEGPEGRRLAPRLIFSDDFDGAALDEAHFRFELGADIRNDEVQTYTDRPENVTVAEGHLVLTAVADSFDGSPFSSGSINTEGLFSFTFGRIEARMAAPVARGCSPAFWLLPEDPMPAVRTCLDDLPCYDGTWPAWGDVTIANLQSQLPNQVLGTASYGIWDDAVAGVTHGVFSRDNAPVQTPTAFHDYALEWGPARLDWFVDGVLVRSLPLPPEGLYLPDDQDPFQKPFHVRLNLAIGGLDQDPDPALYPQELRVDWIRVWQWQEE